MKIGLISDTHGYVDAWNKALALFGEIDFAIHTGDILSSGPFNPRLESYQPAELAKAMNVAPFPILFARGNCDAEIDAQVLNHPIQSPYAFTLVDGLRMLATHGHLHSEEELAELGRRYRLHLIVRGHTHIKGIQKVGDIYLVNPGSAALPKDETGVPTAGLLEGVGDGFSLEIISLEDGTVIDRADIALA